MNEIICPHCNKAFKIDESGYADIIKQIRDREFDKQLNERLTLAEKDKRTAIELAEAKVTSTLERDLLKKDAEIQRLSDSLKAIEDKQKLTITEAVNAIEKDRDKLKGDLQHAILEKQLAEKSLKDKYETQIKDRDYAIERLRDLKARLSTKMVGETLEQHCETEFNRLRATAFPKAYFEKDNNAQGGSKGDYIFRDSDDNGTEVVSIMFEMKNECDATATKKKNEDLDAVIRANQNALANETDDEDDDENDEIPEIKLEELLDDMKLSDVEEEEEEEEEMEMEIH